MANSYIGLFDVIGPVMVGPSSSHTSGAATIAWMARQIFSGTPVKAEFTLYGSFAETYKGHGTDRALIGGMLGYKSDDVRIRNAYYEVRKEYPDFIASVVGTGLKYTTLDRSLTDMLLDNALYIRENLKDDFDPDNIHEFLIGIDLVNEEDKSRPLIEFADQLDKMKKENPDLQIMLHAGESLYAYSDNVIDAYLLGAERIGHGLNLYRFPEIMELVREGGICLEVCPISNQVLEYVEDLRGHPATEYLKRGVPISICSDDPAYQEHATLTDDFFSAIVCWDLGLAEIKQLCLNSITCSGMDDLQREELMQSWQKQWDTFLNDLEAGV